jgi:HSP20 family protein
MHSFQTTLRRGLSRPLDELREELDRLWAPLTAAAPLHGWGTMARGAAFPAVNLSESDDTILVEAELPGLASDALEVSVTGEELVISGSRPETGGGDGEGEARPVWHRRERGTGSFERRLTLPAAVDADRVEARLVDGVLRITCPKAAEAKPRKISVQAS